MLKKWMLTAAAVCIVAGLLACERSAGPPELGGREGDKAQREPANRGENEPFTIRYFSTASHLNYGGIVDLIANWEKITGHVVHIQSIQDDQYDNVVKAKLAEDGQVDIFLGEYQKYDVPNQLLEIRGEEFESRLHESALQILKYKDGHIYAFPGPMGLGAWGVFYNKQIFNELGLSVPKTMDDFNKNLAVIQARGITPLFFAAQEGWTLLQHRNAVIGAVGGMDPALWDQLNHNLTQWKDIPAFNYQYKQVEEWVKRGYLNRNLTATYDHQKQALATGKAAMVIQGVFFDSEVSKVRADVSIGFFPLPNKDGTARMALSGASQMYIAKNSRHAEAAKDLLRYLSEKEQVKAYLEKSPGISAFRDVDVSAHLSSALLDVQAVIRAGNTANHGDDVYVVPIPYEELVAAYTELMAGRMTADQFVQTYSEAYVRNGKTAQIPGFK
ncbi:MULTISPECIES: ABC transporter substrate-binding protein [unclassified Paenibacillus]|uniref:ABC transporter substrate-binding protein n=1 Tax=unclassified Paenibacillus TaxID=185978 RepID=UPI0023793F88|nr:extracellular solute-binding protein [Paenibacillus sp. MAHUQ-63]